MATNYHLLGREVQYSIATPLESEAAMTWTSWINANWHTLIVFISLAVAALGLVLVSREVRQLKRAIRPSDKTTDVGILQGVHQRFLDIDPLLVEHTRFQYYVAGGNALKKLKAVPERAGVTVEDERFDLNLEDKGFVDLVLDIWGICELLYHLGRSLGISSFYSKDPDYYLKTLVTNEHVVH